MDKGKSYLLSESGYNFHYITFIEKETHSGDPYLGKELSLLTLNTIKRWATEGFGNFNSPQRRIAFINKIEATVNQIQKGAYNGAENKIANDIIPFMESSVTGPFRHTFGLLLESSLIGVIQAEDTVEADISYQNILNANPYSLQEIEAIICKPSQYVYEVIVPEPTLEDSLQAVSCALAMGLEKGENREILYKYLTNSPYNEHKIYLKDYVNTLRSDGKTVIATMSLSSGYTENYLLNFVNNHTTWALYFPDSSHYKNWIENPKEITPWVTYAPPLNDLDVTELISYTQEGEIEILSAKYPPNWPTLVLTPEPPESLSEIIEYSIYSYPIHSVISNKGNSKDKNSDDEYPYFMDLFVTKRMIIKSCEPWYLGALEIYIKINPDNTNPYSQQFHHDYPEKRNDEDDCEFCCVNKRNKWYTFNLWERDLYPQGQNHRIMPVKSRWPNLSENGRFKLKLYEDDWPDGDDPILSTYIQGYARGWKYGETPYEDPIVRGDSESAWIYLYIGYFSW